MNLKGQIANILTILRFILIFIFLILIFLPSLFPQIIAVVIFIGAALTDWLDGYIARSTRQVTHIGRIVDPLADWFLILGALLVFCFKGIISWWIFGVVFVRDLILAAGYSLLSQRSKGIISVGFFGKIINFWLVGAITLLLIYITFVKIPNLMWFFYLLFYSSIFLYIFSGLVYIIQGIKQTVEERGQPTSK